MGPCPGADDSRLHGESPRPRAEESPWGSMVRSRGRARGLSSPAGSPCSKHGSGSRDEVPLPLRCRNFNRAGHGFQASESTAPANAEVSGQLVHPASGLLNHRIRKSRTRDIRSAMRWSRILGYTFFGGALATLLAITQLALDLSHGWWIAAVLGAPALLLTAKLVLTENFVDDCVDRIVDAPLDSRSEEHTSELQSRP